ncbi:putative transcription factor C3H family [Lupinus albus]|uniref:Putative transcription factor C3H family n=1 Tax=Lupinus albus TaxID=3870 RepID=A0A6A4N6L0_LUPAL|nr:putative transcription factor C3H family [Lupinus albus]
MESEKRLKLSSPSSSTFTTPIPNHLHVDDFYKTQLCRKFREGFCTFGSECRYAHGIAELKPRQQQQQLCRMFLHNKQCSYGHSCRFIHVNANPNFSHGSQPQVEKVDGYSSAKCTTMQTSAAATNVSTSSLQKNEPSSYISPREHPRMSCFFIHSIFIVLDFHAIVFFHETVLFEQLNQITSHNSIVTESQLLVTQTAIILCILAVFQSTNLELIWT